MPIAQSHPVVIAGGGIGGLALALTLHQIGVPSVVLEATQQLRPLGVGINLQPNAVKELFDLGLTRSELDKVGLPITEWALVGLNGRDIYSEPRGELAGYNWPQYAVHRGKFHMLLRDLLVARADADVLVTDRRVTGFTQSDATVDAHWTTRSGATGTTTGALLIGADGIHSAVRAQMFPKDVGVLWGGAVMWRGTRRARPVRGTSSFVGLGAANKRLIVYPISHPHPTTGHVDLNWIAEVTMSPDAAWANERWFTPVPTSSFVAHFQNWRYDWLDVPALISATEAAYENPMIDRAPLPHWYQGRVGLMGDAAHAMYPTGSNGATQAVIDARVLGLCMSQHGASSSALAAYDARLCAPVSALQLRNRSDGPFGLLKEVDARCGGQFDDINKVMPLSERRAFMADYRLAAGFAMAELNAEPPLLPPT